MEAPAKLQLDACQARLAQRTLLLRPISKLRPFMDAAAARRPSTEGSSANCKNHLPCSSTRKQHEESTISNGNEVSRRASMLLVSTLAAEIFSRRAGAAEQPPQGYKLLRDRLDGYSFFLPETWTPLSSSGNDVFYRNPYNVNENLFVSISSPSSSRYDSVDDLKSPENAAERTKQQYLRELLSTRLGVKRTTDIVSASERVAPDGKKYYDLQLEARSYASRNQLAVSQKQIDAAFELEWDRSYITVLGVANKRLYEFRLQTAKETFDKAKDTLLEIAQSFRCVEVNN